MFGAVSTMNSERHVAFHEIYHCAISNPNQFYERSLQQTKEPQEYTLSLEALLCCLLLACVVCLNKLLVDIELRFLFCQRGIAVIKGYVGLIGFGDCLCVLCSCHFLFLLVFLFERLHVSLTKIIITCIRNNVKW